jgi:hypothetical protein
VCEKVVIFIFGRGCSLAWFGFLKCSWDNYCCVMWFLYIVTCQPAARLCNNRTVLCNPFLSDDSVNKIPHRHNDIILLQSRDIYESLLCNMHHVNGWITQQYSKLCFLRGLCWRFIGDSEGRFKSAESLGGFSSWEYKDENGVWIVKVNWVPIRTEDYRVIWRLCLCVILEVWLEDFMCNTCSDLSASFCDEIHC